MNKDDLPFYPFGNSCWFDAIMNLSKRVYNECPKSIVKMIDKFNKDLECKEFKLGDPMPKDLVEAILMKLYIGVQWEEYKNGSLVSSYIMNPFCTVVPDVKIVFTYNDDYMGHYSIADN
jgi:mRNA-degrading endonuclease YafQ of YafQ-DinJ toxin-antitoxin module